MTKRKLIISTGNKNKVNEIKSILKGLPIEVLSKTDIGLESLQVVEDGDTLEENCIKKAKVLSEKVDFMVMADDTGLFVDELFGEPGVYSSRYAGEEGNDRKNNEKLLNKLEDLTNRKCKFITVISLITEDKEIFTVEGECKGSIALDFKGEGGFGYDPLFIPEGYTETFAELGHDIKNQISHRANALKNLRNTLTNILKDDIDENSCS